MKKRLHTMLLLLFGVITGVFSQSKTISGGNDHGLIICAEGYLYTWGNNVSPSIGGPLLGIDESLPGYDAAQVYSPMRVKTDGLTFNQVTAGSGAFNVALACNGLVYAWGENTNGACGQGPSAGNIVQYPSPVLKGETPGYELDGKTAGGDYLGGVVYVAANTASSFAIMEDGRVVGWGGTTGTDATPLANSKGLPVYIKDANGNDLKHVTHITGGDHNCYFMVDEDGDGAGRLYAIGGVNGSGGTEVEKLSNVAVPVVTEDGTPLDDIRMSAAADKGGYAVTGDGYVWSWGDGGWGGLTGIGSTMSHNYAKKVVSGEYKSISHEDYLTDVVEVIGGRGHGAAITKEGYLVYWGCNNDNGGVAPVPHTGNVEKGPVLAYYCKNGSSTEKGELVKDAVSISRGDNFDFMINSKDEYYVWGLNDLGQCGTGSATVSKYTCLTKLNTIPCDPQDNCPSVFMINRNKCPGEEIELDCGFTIPTGKEERYFVTWKKDGVILNSSKSTDDKSVRESDDYNKSSIFVTEPGTYTVEIEYIGGNIPCDKCKLATTKCIVADMEMPIDTIVKTTCVDKNVALNPPSAKEFCYEFKVNNKFYKAGTPTSWIVRSKTGAALDTIEVEAGSKGSFCVTGDAVKANGNAPIDTTYSIWVEDNTKMSEFAFQNKSIAAGTAPTGATYTQLNKGACYYVNFQVFNDIELGNLNLLVKAGNQATSVKMTATVYNSVTTASTTGNQPNEDNNVYHAGSKIGSASASASLKAEEDTVLTIDLTGIKLKANTARGTVYTLCISTNDQINIYTQKFNVGNTSLFDGKVTFIEGDSHHSDPVGTYASVKGNVATFNLEFFKLTDYTCGEIELQNRLWCPPCNQPDPFDIEVTGATPSKDTIYLCEESDAVKLSVPSVKKSADNNAFFDELWFLNKVGADADALQTDTKKQSTTLAQSISWTAAKEGTTEKYYVKVRDNEKPDADDCFVFDSIIVKYNKKPIAPDIDDIAICENASATEKQVLTNALAGADFNGLTVTWYTDDTKATKASEPDLSTLTESDKTYYYDVQDNETGCYSDVNSLQITIYGVPADPVADLAPFCVGDAVSLAQTSPAKAYEVIWYDENDAQLSSNSLATLPAKDYTYHYQLKSPAPANCLSDKIAYQFTAQDYTSLVLDTVMECGKTTVSANSTVPATATLTWSLEGAVVSSPVFTVASGKVGNIGKVSVEAKQTGYCDKTFEMENVYVKDIPTPPTGEKKVTYLKTDAVNDVFKNLMDQNPEVVKVEAGYTLQWYDASGNKLSSCPVPPYPAATETSDKTYVYKVSRINADGCESESVDINVTVYLTPAPTTTDISYCLNSPNVVPLTATINDPNGAGGFSLQWYDLNNQKAASITPDVSVAGKYTYHVTQISSDGAESSPADLTVTVYEVLEPTLSTTNQYEYCAESSTVSLEASLNSDGDIHSASALVWSLKDENGDYKVVPNANFSLDVTSTTTYQYAVHQTFTTSSDEVCVGPAVEKEVKVTYVPPVVTHEVLYLKAAANADGTFTKNLLEQNSSAVEYTSGATLVWYESDCTTKITSGVPSPKVDPTVPEGSEQNESYCVSQVIDGCESTPTPIAVRISDALPPTPYTYHYCEGATMEDLKADINKLTANSQYELYWYGDQEPATTSASDNVVKGSTFPMNGKKAALDATGGVTTLKYWVAQHDLSTDAVSSAQPVIITIYPQPVVAATDPAPVCEENVNLALSGSVSNVSYNVNYHYYKDGVEMVGTSTAIMSGAYSISAEYTLPATASSTVIVDNNGVCAGPQSAVNVVINDLTVPEILGFYTTCPGTSVTLHASATSTDPGTSNITYAWSADPASAIASAQGDSMTTTTLSTVPDTKYLFSVTATAGACVKSVPTGAEHDVTIGNGQVKGTMVLQEDDNYEGQKFTFANDMERRFLSCGKPVNIKVDYVTTEGTYTWYKNGQPWKTGAEVTTDELNMDSEDVYTVEFINQCKATASVTIETVPLSASPISQDLVEICEGVPFTTSFTYQLRAGLTPAITWYHEGHEIGGQTDPVMTLNNTKDEDDGVYSYTIQNNGCIVEGVANTLNVKPYIRATIQSEPFVVDRHQTATLPITFAVPSNGSQNIQWMENEQQVYDKNPYIVSDVTADHEYDIYLTDPDYCGDTLHATLYVDAELQLKTEMKDVICLGNSAVLKIDTTGTGKFRNPNSNPVLDISYVENGITHSLNDKIRKNGDTLEVTVSPEIDTEYQVTFTYTSQLKKQELVSKEQIEVIPAISLTTPAVPNVCEGGEAVLEVKDVSPEGTTVSWKADPTILSGENTTTVRVQPTYAGGAQPFEGGASYQSLYTYTAIAYNDFCQTSVEYAVPVIVDQPLSGDITGVSEICEGFEATFDASSYNASTYSWSPDTLGLLPRAIQTVKPEQSTQYIVEMTRGLCSASDTFIVTVHSNPVIESIDSIALRDRQIVLVQDLGEAPFLYGIDVQPADGNDIKTNLTFSKHTVNVTDRYGCKTTGSFRLDPPAIIIPEVVTDNGDGINDVWKIPNLAEVYPNAIVSIYDRFGKLLAQFLGADAEGWDCTYMGKKLPSTDYWYQITIEEINREFTGHFTLIRR